MAAFLIIATVVAAFVLIPFIVAASGYEEKTKAIKEKIAEVPLPESLHLYYDKLWLLLMAPLLLVPCLILIAGHLTILIESDRQIYHLFLAPLTFGASLFALPTARALANINRPRISLLPSGIHFFDRQAGSIVTIPWPDVIEIQPFTFRANSWLRIEFSKHGQQLQANIGQGFTKNTFEFDCWVERFWKTYRTQG